MGGMVVFPQPLLKLNVVNIHSHAQNSGLHMVIKEAWVMAQDVTHLRYLWIPTAVWRCEEEDKCVNSFLTYE